MPPPKRLRLKYPHLVHAAVASSAPVQASLEMRGYNDVVAASLAAGGGFYTISTTHAPFTRSPCTPPRLSVIRRRLQSPCLASIAPANVSPPRKQPHHGVYVAGCKLTRRPFNSSGKINNEQAIDRASAWICPYLAEADVGGRGGPIHTTTITPALTRLFLSRS